MKSSVNTELLVFFPAMVIPLPCMDFHSTVDTSGQLSETHNHFKDIAPECTERKTPLMLISKAYSQWVGRLLEGH